MNQLVPPPQPRILVAPLDWGLGHATRCIPIIRLLLQRGCTVFLAGEGKVEHLLRTEFPQLHFLPLEGYRINYAASSFGLITAMLRQIPNILKAIKKENAWLAQMVQQHRLNAVISDNRYGLYHPQVHSVLITHQLQIQTPFGRAGGALLQKLNYRFINRFSACWVPDVEAAPGLAGALAHPKKMPAVPVNYVGALSRFKKGEEELEHYVLVLLSGPEPQRTLLENKLLAQVKDYGAPVLFIRGLPGNVGLPKVPYHVTIVNHLSANAMHQALNGAQFVIARTGYTTVMGLLALQKKEHFNTHTRPNRATILAKLLMRQNRALCLPQQKFELSKAVALANAFPYKLDAATNNNNLQVAVDALLNKIKHGKQDV